MPVTRGESDLPFERLTLILSRSSSNLLTNLIADDIARGITSIECVILSGDYSMPISHSLDSARKQVSTIVRGTLTADEIISHLDAVRRERTLEMPELIDLRRATPPFLSAAEIWRVSEEVHKTLEQHVYGPRALIAGSEVVYGLARMFSTLVSDLFPMRVFRDETEAEGWLSLCPVSPRFHSAGPTNVERIKDA